MSAIIVAIDKWVFDDTDNALKGVCRMMFVVVVAAMLIGFVVGLCFMLLAWHPLISLLGFGYAFYQGLRWMFRRDPT